MRPIRLSVSLLISAMPGLLIASAAAAAAGTTHAFVGARLLPIDAPPVDDGALIVRDGRIIAVGPRAAVSLPGDAEVHDLTGRTLMPGLVDTHTHIGGPAGADGSGPIQPDCRALDAIDVRDAGLQKAQAGGITTVNVMPGSSHLMSGQTVYLKLRDASTVEALALRDATGHVLGGMKMANGTNSQKDPPFPGTRGKSAALVRERFVAAREYQRKLLAAKGDLSKLPDRDLGLEAMVEVLEGRRVVHHHTHRHDDIMTVLRLRDEFGFRLVLHHVSEGWKVADELARAKVPCSIIVLDSPGGKHEAVDLVWSNGAALEKAGVPVAYHTDDGITDSRLFLRSAALAVRGGMSRQAALEALTIAGARMLDLEDRVGTLTPGKDADFVILSGDPLSIYSHVVQTWVEGVKVFDRDDPQDRLWATGGWGASRPQQATWCCFEGADGQHAEAAQ